MPTLKEAAFSKQFLLKCKGYNPKFINGKANIGFDRILSQQLSKNLPKVEGAKKGILNYTGLSVLYNTKRKVPFLSAYNIDGTQKAKQLPRPQFKTDPRITEASQLDDDFYDLRKDITEFEIGHMASNNEMGRGKDGPIRAFQTFHFTNSVPQAERLNTGIWKGLESYIIKEAAEVNGNKKICVFTGPVLRNNDPGYVKLPSFKIPLLFFKVIVFKTPKGFFSTAFVMSHEKKLIEDKMFVPRRLRGIAAAAGAFEDFPYRKIFQVNIDFLEKISGLKFSWKGVKPLHVPQQKHLVQKIKNIKDAKEAKKAIASIRKGNVPTTVRLVDKEVSNRELKRNDYTLNLILP